MSGQADGAMINIAPSGSQWVMVGEFKHAFGYAVNGIARLKNDWSGLDSTATDSFNYNINKYRRRRSRGDPNPAPGSNVVMAGTFSKLNNIPCGHIVRLDTNGNVDTTFNVVSGGNGSGLDDRVKRMYIVSGSTNFQITRGFPELQ